jgi:hypothetical protein
MRSAHRRSHRCGRLDAEGCWADVRAYLVALAERHKRGTDAKL